MTEEIQIIDASGMEVFEAQERAQIDMQVATAKRYPRNLQRVIDNSIKIATMDKETAESCRYSKPVAGKAITGVSVHLARIICQQYGNIIVLQRIKSIDAKSIVAEAVAWDMETNYKIGVEARRSIIDKNGIRYKESVIETNAMAILAIAERNAILKILPKSIVNKAYDEAFKMANGDLSDTAKFIKARDAAFDYFANEYGATEEEVYTCIGLKTKEAVKPDHVVTLRGFVQSLKDKEITPEELFNRSEKSKRGTSEKEIIEQPDPVQPSAKIEPADPQQAFKI